MKGIEFIDALSQIDPALADSYLNGEPAAEQNVPAAEAPGIVLQKTAKSAAEHPRRLKLLSAAGVLGSVAACAALAFGFWKFSAPERSSTEQVSEVSMISLDADSTDDSAAAVTTAAVTEQTTAASVEKAASKTTAAQTTANTAKTTAAGQKTVTSVKNAGNGNANSTQASGRTNKSSAQTTAKPAQTTAAPKQTTTAPQPQKLTVPNFIGMSTDQIISQYLNQYMIYFDEPQFSDVTKNAICAQDIPAGTEILATDVIRVHQSLGPATVAYFPDLIGKQEDEACQILRKLGLIASPCYSGCSDLPFGTVVNAGQDDSDPQVVYITLSNGLGNGIPNVVGKDYWNEVISFYGTDINFTITKVEASDYPDGTVLSQSVAPGTPFNKRYNLADDDSENALDSRPVVNVTISGSGRELEPVIMPDLIGEVVSPNAPYHEKLDVFYNDYPYWSIGFTQDETSDQPYGTIISQTPAPGTPAYAYSPVEFVVSTSKSQTVSLPNPVGMSVREAIDMIQAKGCVPIMVPEPEYDPTVPDFTVIRAEPGDLTNIKIGSGVRLIVSISDPDLAGNP